MEPRAVSSGDMGRQRKTELGCGPVNCGGVTGKCGGGGKLMEDKGYFRKFF